MRKEFVWLLTSKLASALFVAVSFMVLSSIMSAATEMNIQGVVVIAGGPCGAQPVGGGVCRGDDEAGEGVRLVFVVKATGEVGGTVTAGTGGRFAARLEPGVYDVRLASGQTGALRLEPQTVRVPAQGNINVSVRLQSLRP
jgi:hypothetical protein